MSGTTLLAFFFFLSCREKCHKDDGEKEKHFEDSSQTRPSFTDVKAGSIR